MNVIVMGFLDQLRQSDLNLLVTFSVLAEEKNISNAARRLYLSQPAVSRSLKRLRDLFGDELLLRGKTGYELSSQGKRIKTELEVLLPRLNQLIYGFQFDPYKDEVSFKITGTDYALKVLSQEVCTKIIAPKMKTSVQFKAWSPTIYTDLEQGQVDLAFLANDGLIPSYLKTERLYMEELVCIVDRRMSKIRSSINLRQYLEADHIIVSLVDLEQTLPDKVLKKLGTRRKARIRVPYFAAAIDIVEGTDLIATVPKRFISDLNLHKNLNIVKPPKELGKFEYVICWHPRLNQDPAHEWLRQEIQQIFI